MPQRSFTLIETVLYSCLFILSLFFYYNIEHWVMETLPTTLQPSYFPSLVTFLMTGLFALLVLVTAKTLYQYGKIPLTNDISKHGAANEDSIGTDATDTGAPLEKKPSYLLLIAYIATLFAYLLALPYFGFLITTPIIMFCVAYLLGLKRYFIAFPAYCFFAWLINTSSFHILQIILPQGTVFY